MVVGTDRHGFLQHRNRGCDVAGAEHQRRRGAVRLPRVRFETECGVEFPLRIRRSAEFFEMQCANAMRLGHLRVERRGPVGGSQSVDRPPLPAVSEHYERLRETPEGQKYLGPGTP